MSGSPKRVNVQRDQFQTYCASDMKVVVLLVIIDLETGGPSVDVQGESVQGHNRKQPRCPTEQDSNSGGDDAAEACIACKAGSRAGLHAEYGHDSVDRRLQGPRGHEGTG